MNQPYKYSPNNTGAFRHRIAFFEECVTTDELLQEIVEEIEVANEWAMIKTVNGREFFSAASTQNEDTYRFIVRYRNDLTPDMRIKFKERTFEIVSILNDDELDKTLTIIAKGRI